MARSPEENRDTRQKVGARVAEEKRRREAAVGAVEDRTTATETQNADQAGKINDYRAEINTLTAQNIDQATKIQELRGEVNAANATNADQAAKIGELRADINALQNFQGRPSGFAGKETNDTTSHKHS